jgi:hypothetical protein
MPLSVCKSGSLRRAFIAFSVIPVNLVLITLYCWIFRESRWRYLYLISLVERNFKKDLKEASLALHVLAEHPLVL